MTQTATRTPSLPAAEMLRGMDLGIVTHAIGGFVIADRHCTGCRVLLPKVTADGRLDTFPRCSAHAL